MLTTLLIIGTLLLSLSIIFHFKKIVFSVQNTSLLVLGLGLIATYFIQPKIIKFGDLEVELQSLREAVKPFALIDLKNKKVIYSTLKKTQIKILEVNAGAEDGTITILLSSKPEFFHAYFNGIWKTQNKFYREEQMPDGWYKISMEYFKYSIVDETVDASKLPDPEKMIIELIGPGDLYDAE